MFYSILWLFKNFLCWALDNLACLRLCIFYSLVTFSLRAKGLSPMISYHYNFYSETSSPSTHLPEALESVLGLFNCNSVLTMSCAMTISYSISSSHSCKKRRKKGVNYNVASLASLLPPFPHSSTIFIGWQSHRICFRILNWL